MTRRVVACVLVSFFLILLVYNLNPTFILQARTEDGTSVFCVRVERGDDILYLSINSIYKVRVQERLRVRDDGTLAIVQVVSTPDVVYYYGIESFTPLENGLVSAVPNEIHYREVRIKIGRSGQQFLVVGGQQIALYELVPEDEAVTLEVRQAPRALACK